MSSLPLARRPRTRAHWHSPPDRDQEALKWLYRTKILGFPGPVDHWLITNSRTGGSLNFLRNYMYLVDLNSDHNVQCLVKRRRRDALRDYAGFDNPPRYTLELTCWVSAASGVSPRFRVSPRVCLDQFIGLPGAFDVPDWVNQERPFAKFFQPRGVIAETFVQLSKSRANQHVQSLPARMIEWAKAITIGLWPVYHQPQTSSVSEHADDE